jgi:hypothetical protein
MSAAQRFVNALKASAAPAIRSSSTLADPGLLFLASHSPRLPGLVAMLCQIAQELFSYHGSDQQIEQPKERQVHDRLQCRSRVRSPECDLRERTASDEENRCDNPRDDRGYPKTRFSRKSCR